MGSWNYRVVSRTVTTPAGYVETWFAIHEAYYKRKNSKKPYCISKEPTPIIGDTLEEMQSVMKMMAKSFDKPVLQYDDF